MRFISALNKNKNAFLLAYSICIPDILNFRSSFFFQSETKSQKNETNKNENLINSINSQNLKTIHNYLKSNIPSDLTNEELQLIFYIIHCVTKSHFIYFPA